MSDIPPPPETEFYPDDTAMDYSRAAGKVAPPAIILMVFAGIGFVLRLFDTYMMFMNPGFLRELLNSPEMEDLMQVSPMLEELLRAIENTSGSAIQIGFHLIGYVFFIFMFVGAYKMYKLQSWGWAMTAAILACIPCFNCCCFSLPVGIWALIVLNDVKGYYP